ncbi:MAG: hypothetical protein AAGC57_16645 [Pseudomonadota bacterium]
MTLLRHTTPVPPLPSPIADWAEIPPAIASDCLNRGQAMAGAIAPMALGLRAVGRAGMVRCKIGDNSPLHAALSLVEAGDLLVVDAGGHPNTAVFGGLLARVALARGVAGVVVDGAVRDRDELAELNQRLGARGCARGAA